MIFPGILFVLPERRIFFSPALLSREMNTSTPTDQSDTTYSYAHQPKLSKMENKILILIFLTIVSFLGTGAHGSEFYNNDTRMNAVDTGHLTDAGNQSLFSDFFKNWLNKGLTLTNDGKYAEALQAFDNAFKYHPGEKNLTARAWGGRARVYDALERYDEALAASNEVLNLSPDDPKLTESAWVTRGIALRYLGRYEESLEAFNQALVLDPGNTRTRQLRIFTLRLMHADG